MGLWIFLLSFFFSFGVQFLFYLYYRSTNNKILKFKTVVDYHSGIIGDGVLVPLLNVSCYLTLQYFNHSYLNSKILTVIFIVGFIVTYTLHYYQQKLKLTNWTMPEVGKWNLLGGYHSLFMFFETSFLAYTLLASLLQINNEGLLALLISPIKYSFLILGAFAATFLYDYRKALKIPYLG